MKIFGVGDTMKMTNENLTDCRQRANHGDISAMRELGNFLRDEAERNFSEAFKWFIKAANFGDAGAFLLVGDMCRFGQGTPKNPLKALDCYKKVANNSRVNLSDRQDAESRIAEIVDEIHGRKVDDLIAALIWRTNRTVTRRREFWRTFFTKENSASKKIPSLH